ncbi:3'-5' exonuclease [Halomonas sp. 18H]|uniref:3'-5' exonuclease n=1 Tax=Halomonas almeriensis TaxID=308163 RepID=UPI00222FDE21|nr:MULTISPECIES: 3'-5' exonuclease [Halomonas]MCW4149522.1 3'-5' exonuclease [Halomonas sp. 18H]MDN3553532.1 3'-5' exonuclease [Halomonas almeriensis]
MFRVLRRVADRHRHANSQFGWLFQPYMGDELIALAFADGGTQDAVDPLRVAAVCIRAGHCRPEGSLTLCLPADSWDALMEWLNFIGNRPLVTWSAHRELSRLNLWLRPHLGFDLPNAVVDVARLYQRRQRYRHPQLERRPGFEEAARRLAVPEPETASPLCDKALATACMYRQLVQRDAPGWQGG